MSNSALAATHWGFFELETRGGKIVAVRGVSGDESPSPIGQSLLDAQDENVRIPRPMVRKGYLERGLDSDGSRRGRDPFVAVSWDEALDLAADALATIRQRHGNEAIFGGSHGWSSAGRFHHAQSQIHRFLNLLGGYVDQVDTYSIGAGNVIMRYVIGVDGVLAVFECVPCDEMAEHTELVVSFGGIAMKNTQVNSGGVGNHSAERQLRRLAAAGTRFVNISPLKEDMADFLEPTWLCIRPCTDTAVMLALAHTLYVEGLHDGEFLARYTVGFEQFLPYLLGRSDGVAKDAQWAARIAGIPAEAIVELAREMAKKRTLISASWSLQRQEHGEQPWWMAMVLASMLGYVGLPGGGVNYGFGSIHNVGFHGRKRFSFMTEFKFGDFPTGNNPLATFIPVARIADMLLNPGAVIDYAGQRLKYPEVKAIVWAGGNPFHHHQDLNKLVRAWARPQVVIVNEIGWNSLARHADIVFPVTSTVERDDVAASRNDFWLTPNHKAVEPFAESRHDFEVYSALAQRLGFGDQFTEGRSIDEWVRHVYGVTVKRFGAKGIDLPDFETFWRGGPIDVSDQIPPKKYMIERFREDPDGNPLKTPSGKIEIYSQTIADYGYDDCLGHPAWFEKREWLGGELARRFPLHLLSHQPKGKLHSQLDYGVASRKRKVKGREVLIIHPTQAERRGIRDGDIVRVFNDRGSCLAAAGLDDALHPQTVVLPTGAWYDPLDPDTPGSLDVHGNPNVVTQDVPSSRLAQGCSAHSCLVEVERYEGELPPIRVFRQPATAERPRTGARASTSSPRRS
jgi:biotin/methionine sulfoxide reductase